MTDWKPRIDEASGLPLEMKTPGGKVLPLLLMERRAHTNKYCKDKPCKNGAHWDTFYTNYLQVAHRIVWFREEHPDWGVESSVISEDPAMGWAWVRCTISDASGILKASASKYEERSGWGDYREKAETGAFGRALAWLGYGTQFAPDLDEGGVRLADAPVNETPATEKKARGRPKKTEEVPPAPEPPPQPVPPESVTQVTQMTQAGGGLPPALRKVLVENATAVGAISGNQLFLTMELAKKAGVPQSVAIEALSQPQAQTLAGLLFQAKHNPEAATASTVKDDDDLGF